VRLLIEATAEELRADDAADRLAQGLVKALGPYRDDAEQALSKARKAPVFFHKDKVLATLHERMRGAYAAQLRLMQRDIAKVLNDGN
jgi:hypothetical protein